jgi:hypothetical protein
MGKYVCLKLQALYAYMRTTDKYTPPRMFCRFRGIFFIFFLEEPDRNLQLSTIRFCLFKNGAN